MVNYLADLRAFLRWSEKTGGTGVSSLTRMAYTDRVWALLGSIDGASTHLAEQVVAKARLSLLDPMSTDGTINQANVAWAFSTLPSDQTIAKALLQGRHKSRQGRRFLG